MSRRVLFYSLALVILLGGLALAVFLIPARTCGMDDFTCQEARNMPKVLVGIGAIVAAFVVAAVGMFQG